MRHGVTFTLLLVILIPVVLLLWMGQEMRNGQIHLRERLREAAQLQLDQIRVLMSEYSTDIEKVAPSSISAGMALLIEAYVPPSTEDYLVLMDENGNILHEWGEPPPEDASSSPLTASLAPPFEAYKLEYHLNLPIDTKLATRLQMFVSLVLLFLGGYLYLEHFRTSGEAARKVTFVNQVSHELKTPLTNIRLYAELLERDIPEDNTTALDRLHTIQGEIRRLGRLIRNVLMFSRDEKRRPDLVNCNVDALIHQVVDIFRPGLEQKNIKLVLDTKAGEVVCDQDGLEQILVNLISNAEKYALTGKEIHIRSWTGKDGRTRVEVQDQGSGVPARLRERIFEPFFRINNSLTEGVSGTGIGLSIARDLARRAGGDLRLKDTGTRGACFEVLI